MATYPQGVSSFIPDYQPFEPDLNFAANVLQLKQTQYDQNWHKINNIYGQIANAPLSHSESARRRANTLNAIDFDLKRISGLDLSLDQNVYQATQIFRPLYEDQNLMKDIAFTKNASFERSLGEGKRISTDEKIRSEYWEGGLNYIDQKIRDFQALPYDKLTSFGDVQYVPYINVEQKAFELAKEMDYTIDVSQPNGQWIIRERNGQQVIPKLQSVFYSILGEDPMIQQVYDVQAYLHRKSTIASTKDTKYGGDEIAAERAYLNDALKTLRKQSETTGTAISEDKKSNNKKITELKHKIAKGDTTTATAEALRRYQEANAQIDKHLKANQENLKLISNDINRTATTKGGANLSFDDIENMRMRVDAVVASNMLQLDLDKAAEDVAYKDYLLDYEADPYGVMHQKYLYDVDLIDKRKEAQKEVEDHKAKIEADKALRKTRLDSGLFYEDPISGELKIKEELDGAVPLDFPGKTGPQDPMDLLNALRESYEKETDKATKAMGETLEYLWLNGYVTDSQVYEMLEDKSSLGYDYEAFKRWLMSPEGADIFNTPSSEAGEYFKKLPADMQQFMQNQSLYVTELEKENLKTPEGQGGTYVDKKGNIRKASPAGAIGAVIEQRLKDLKEGDASKISSPRLIKLKNNIDKKLDLIAPLYQGPSAGDTAIRAKLSQLTEAGVQLENYVDQRKSYEEFKIELEDEIVNKLKIKGFNYGRALFDANHDMVTSEEEFVYRATQLYGDEMETSSGFTWSGLINTAMVSGTAGATLGAPFAGVGAIPGFIGGVVAGAAGYAGSNGLEWLYNSIAGSDEDDLVFKNGTVSWMGNQLSIAEEFEEMLLSYDDLIQDSDLRTPVVGLKNYQQQADGTGLATTKLNGYTIAPGLRNPNYFEWVNLQKVMLNTPELFAQPGVRDYISLGDFDNTYDEIGEDGAKRNASVFQLLYEDLVRESRDPKSTIGTFDIAIAPFAGNDPTLAGVVIRPSKEFLDGYYDPKAKEGENAITKEEYDAILKRGMVAITDADKVNTTTLYKNNFMSTDEAAIRRAGPKGKTYTNPNLPNFSINYRIDKFTPGKESYIVTQNYPIYAGPGKPYEIAYQTDIVPLGYNVANSREAFFNTFANTILEQNYYNEIENGPAAAE